MTPHERNVVRATIILICLGLIALGFVAGRASAAPASPGATSVVSEVRGYVGAFLYRPVPEKPLYSVPQIGVIDTINGPSEAGAYTNDDEITLTSWDDYVLSRFARDRRCSLAFSTALITVAHELTHPLPRDDEDLAPEHYWMEEGFTEAVTVDFMPALWRKLCGPDLSLDWKPGYAKWTNWSRAASAKATGTHWKSYASRKWRLLVLNSNWHDRLRLMYNTEMYP